jgi:hypothetical protein
MRLSRRNSKTPIVLISDDHRDRLLKLLRATQGLAEHESRRNTRISLRSKARVRFRSEDLEAETVNVSGSGVLVSARRIFPIGSQVTITMTFSERMKPIVGTGSVVRSADGLMAIQIDRIAIAESERLREFLFSLVPHE